MIISVSRRTDIPAFYSDWFFNRLKEGFVYVRNPINKNKVSKISLLVEDVDCFIFWSKNPKPFLTRLFELEKFKFYFQFTINSYGSEVEPLVPKIDLLIDTFVQLSKAIGKEKVIWRYDPILLSEKYTIEYHLQVFEFIAKAVGPYTEKCVISFLDIYQKCNRTLKEFGIKAPQEGEIVLLCEKLKEISTKYNLILETCAENIELEHLGIKYGRCIDNVLIERILEKRINVGKDKNQRGACKCIESVDIGSYNTCQHGCLYCYATANHQKTTDLFKLHSSTAPLLYGCIGDNDVITERKCKSITTKTLLG